MRRARALITGLVVALVAARVHGAGPAPVLFQSGPGRFEVAALDATAAGMVASTAEDMWRLLAAPLSLPDGFSSPVLVRLVPGSDWRDAEAFRAIVETGGVVSVRIRWDEKVKAADVRHALARGLLLRLAAARHGAGPRLTAPRWLEEACVGWCETRSDAAQLDALKQESARLEPPGLEDLLSWRRKSENTRSLATGAVWLLAFLQGESGRAGEWPALLNRLVAGDEAGTALAASFPGRFGNEGERELWWETGWHHVRRARALPVLEATESRREIAALARFVFAGDEHDVVVPLREVLAHRSEPPVAEDLGRRAAELNRLLPSLHPFYRNAGLSLAEALGAHRPEAAPTEMQCAAFDRDWRDANELAASTDDALDALERESGAAGIK